MTARRPVGKEVNFEQLKAIPRALGREARALLRSGSAHLTANAWRYVFAAAVLVMVGFFTVPRDKQWVAWISENQEELLQEARELTHWGDFRGTLIVAALLAVVGGWVRRRRLLRAALAVVLAAALAGAVANVGRVVVGRPRPVDYRPDGLYGPTFDYKLNGFPSAHSATASATATVLLVASPWVGVPVAAAALTVMWSRIYLRAHHPTDVLAGAFLGVVFGVGLGLAARREDLGPE